MNIMNFMLQLVLLVFGFVLLIKGADWFVDGAAKIADRFHIPALVIGLTIVAFGTSAPEAAISITAAIKGSADIAVGNVLGSNIMNILIILGLASVILPLSIQKSSLKYELPFVIVITALFAFLGLSDQTIGRFDGIILWACFLLFFVYLIRLAKKGQADMEETPKSEAGEPIWKLIVLTLVGMAAIVLGSDVTVDAATKIAQALHMSERLIGLTIVAFGTSLPELITSVTAAKKGEADIAIGNIIGSNIFNILFVIGTTALITPVPYAGTFMVDSIIAIGAAVLLLVCTAKDRILGRTGGAVMLVSYCGYFAYLLCK